MALASMFNHNEPITTVVGGVSLPSERRVGIEIELENMREEHSSKWWNFKGDSSLRNNGIELVLKEPLAGADLEKSIRALNKILRNENPETSIRTSTHIHVDVRDLDTEQISNIIVLFAAVESYIYTLGGKHRYDNIYCPGFTSSLDLLHRAADMVYRNDHHMGTRVSEWSKYSGLNLHTIRTFGSIEFRMFEATTSPHQLMRWVKTLQQLVDYAASNTKADILALVDQSSDIVSDVFDAMSDVPASIVARNKQNALFIAHFRAVKNNQVRVADQEATIETDNDVDAVLERFRQLAQGV